MNIVRALLILILSLVSISRAEAHAFLDHAEPKVGGTVSTAPAVVKIWFTMKFQPALTTIQVFDSSGKEVDRRNAKVDPSDATSMSVAVPGLSPGTYRVVWKAVCTLGHVTHGSFTFTVGGP